ncbi:hypothetical protein Hanom_Chr10g00965131 [Helianthus anomalus]
MNISTVSKNIFPLLLYNYIYHIYVYIYLPMNTKQKNLPANCTRTRDRFLFFLQNKKQILPLYIV